ncbi:MAG: hypothetical protein LW808_000270 [Verrucomicrobiota bacterium]|nr:MAG: hypothetical protein LW808_000270 [Verrucomicrobiota bacterium]
MSEEPLGEAPEGEIQASVSFGDRAWVFFAQHLSALKQMGIVFAIIVLLAIIVTVGKTVVTHVRERDYNSAVLSGDIEPFAKKYASTKLAGTFFETLGARAYAQADFKTAADYYRRAVAAFGYSPFGGKAEIEEAVSLIRSGALEEGEKLLNNIAGSTKYPGSIQGKAMWLLGMSLWGRQEVARAKDVFNKLTHRDHSSYWQEQATAVLKQL